MKKLYFSILLISQLGFSQSPCNNGFAGSFPCDGFDLIASIDLNVLNAASGNDSWGWTDPLDAKEYAIIGLDNGTAFIDISTPDSPVYLGKLPTHTVNSLWRDIKVYDNYAFVVSEASGHGMQIFDLTKLRNVTNPPIVFSEDAHYDGFGNAHNIVINPEEPFAYAVGTTTFSGGPHIVDISDPLNPVFAGGYADVFYTHDAQVITYGGPDADHQAKEIYIGSNEDEVVILDVSDKQNITTISTIGYSNIGYTHQAWLTEDETYLILGDEFDELQFGFNTRSIIFDLTDLDNPVVHMEYVGNTNAIDHNGYVKDGIYYQASYTSGLRVIDVSDIANQNVTEIGFFDTYPQDNGLGFDGAWNVYPYFESGNLVISDIDTGFYIVRNNTLSVNTNEKPNELTIYPNPTNAVVNFNITNNVIDNIKIYDQLGQLIFEKSDIRDDRFSLVVSGFSNGIYFAKINNTLSRKLIIE
jgi:choice-of-anchor B domain-containing protein